jgi:hypothetical protein
MRTPLALAAVIVAVLTAGAGLAACSAPAAQSTPPAHHAPPAHPVPAAQSTPPRSLPVNSAQAAPASPFHRGLADRLMLQQTTVPAGATIKGTFLVTYAGPTAINLNHGCRPQFAVVLTNRRFPPQAAFASDCTVAPFLIKPGVNRLPFSLQTTYPVCGQPGGQGTASIPPCLNGGQMPPLPVGRYRAVLIGAGLHLPTPAAVPVTLVTARSPAPG